jgi:hypothetical protein
LTPTPAIYKYSTTEHLDRLRDTILDHRVYFPTLGQVNDPADAKPRLLAIPPDKLAALVYRDYAKSHSGMTVAARRRHYTKLQCMVYARYDSWLRRMAEKLYGHVNQNHRIYCLSKHYDNLVMWAKYAGNHSGYCLEFDRGYAPFNIACDVTYVSELPFMDITDPEDRGPYTFIKHIRWSGEEEVRVGALNLNDPKVYFKPACLRRIILGPSMSSEDEEKIREWAGQREPKLEVVKAHFDMLDLKMKLEQPKSGIGWQIF